MPFLDAINYLLTKIRNGYHQLFPERRKK